MKPICGLFAVLGLLLCGCAGQTTVEHGAGEYLGAGPVHVLSSPTRIDGWNFQRADGTIASDPPIRQLNLSIAHELGRILLSEETYAKPARPGGFAHDVGFRVWRNDESVDVLLSFGNDQMQLKYRVAGGAQSSSFSSIAGSRDRLIRVAREAFPDYKPPK